ncbi:FkbM family methyltransferase [Nodosilinea sp. LEGE 07088]|uniref:FkbM family methyltransferase n=1 Tax=Nodosilinea sp. LEGE 07088 TaxID=2777968 RepID=UPI001880A84E|nr:FkbM family methyltransferase [Nodosilinea sp. LEGE 07088]MBE9135939.1 FkbM family methyltransferase [Nodosilinea sp. LEGE 07088]
MNSKDIRLAKFKNFMNENFLAGRTLAYIWNHPNNQKRQTQAVYRFLGWQIWKRFTGRSINISLDEDIKVRCYPDSRSASAALYCGLYDHNEMSFLQRFLQDGDSFLDVGANIGVYTLLAAAKSPTGHIYSIEALPRNVARLKENLTLNQFDHVTVYELAISDSQGDVSLDLADGDSTPRIANQDFNRTLQVSTDTLDNLLHDKSEELTLAKMDIEGAELLAFRGAHLLLQKHCPMVWILEINHQIQNFSYTAEDLATLLDSYGYGLYSYSAEHNQVFSISLAEKPGNNLLAIARPCLDVVRQRLAIAAPLPRA